MISRERVLIFLKEKQESDGGYSGNDLTTLAESTFYRHIKQEVLSIYCSETDNWFKSKDIHFPEDYSLEKNRESLQTIFTFSDMKTYGGANIDAICQRLTKAKEAFSIYNVDANRYYPEILSRSKFLQKLL